MILDLAQRYLDLARLGREPFLEAVPRAALLMDDATRSRRVARGTHPADNHGHRETLVQDSPFSVLAVAKRSGSAFVDVITVGRSDRNDVVIDDPSISQTHGFFRRRGSSWLICDTGSQRGTQVNRRALVPRTELRLDSGASITFGAVAARFVAADDLFDLLCQYC